MVENCCKPVKMSFQSTTPFRYPLGGMSRTPILSSDIASTLSPRTPSISHQDRVLNTVVEVTELIRLSNDANYYADKMLDHIIDYGDSDLLWRDIMSLPFALQDLIMMRLTFTLAVRGELLKALVPLSFYDKLGTEEARKRKDKHIKQVMHILKYFERSDLVAQVHDRFKGYDLL